MARNNRAGRESNRVPVGGNRSKLTIPDRIKDPNFVYRWIVDEDGRFEVCKEAGYEVVEDPNVEVGEGSVDHARFPGNAVVKAVGRTRNSLNGTAVLMRIHKDYYNEDQQAKEDEIQETEQAMFRRNAGQEGFYEKERTNSRS